MPVARLIVCVCASILLVRACCPCPNNAPGCCECAETPSFLPQCTWQCDAPQCDAVCVPQCEPPVCEISCVGAENDVTCAPPQCRVTCPEDQVGFLEECPRCETVCEPAACTPAGAECTPLCEATRCSWACRRPRTCPEPTCELVCEAPACEAPPSLASTTPVHESVAAYATTLCRALTSCGDGDESYCLAADTTDPCHALHCCHVHDVA